MCHHCERIIEHPEDRPIVHAFMELTARRLGEYRREAIDPDDVEIRISISRLFPFSGGGEKLARAGHRLLQEIAKESVW